MSRKFKTEETNGRRLESVIPQCSYDVLNDLRKHYAVQLRVSKVSWGHLWAILSVRYDPNVRPLLEAAGIKVPENV